MRSTYFAGAGGSSAAIVAIVEAATTLVVFFPRRVAAHHERRREASWAALVPPSMLRWVDAMRLRGVGRSSVRVRGCGALRLGVHSGKPQTAQKKSSLFSVALSLPAARSPQPAPRLQTLTDLSVTSLTGCPVH